MKVVPPVVHLSLWGHCTIIMIIIILAYPGHAVLTYIFKCYTCTFISLCSFYRMVQLRRRYLPEIYTLSIILMIMNFSLVITWLKLKVSILIIATKLFRKIFIIQIPWIRMDCMYILCLYRLDLVNYSIFGMLISKNWIISNSNVAAWRLSWCAKTNILAFLTQKEADIYVYIDIFYNLTMIIMFHSFRWQYT